MRRLLKVLGWILIAILLLVVALAIYIYATAIKPASPVGFQQIVAEDAGHNRIPVAIWYPTSAKPGFIMLGSSGARVATDGPVAGSGLPLIVFSHGTGGTAVGHADTAIALAEAGFVVATPTHPGDNSADSSDVGKPQWMLNRSRQVERVIDAMLGKWKDRAHVDPQRVGVFGFSAGATTALITIGGVPDFRRIAPHCTEHPEFACQLVKPTDYRNAPALLWKADPRIDAAVIAAPGLGFTFEPNGLANVHVPVQLWSGAADTTVPYATNTAVVARLLPSPPETHLVPGAAHLSFLMPCGLIGPPQFCRDGKGFDRAAFHRSFNAAVVKFFEAHLPKRAAQ